MSLKSFHIFFIIVSILLTIGVGVWGVFVHVQETHIPFLLLGIGSFVVGIALVIYSVKVIRTMCKM